MLSYLNRARAKRANGEDGFTLIELLVVVVILGILIAIAIPVYLNYRKSANDRAAQSDLRGAVSALEVCNSNGGYPTAITTGTTAGASTGSMTACGGSSVTTAQQLPLSTGSLVTLYTYTASNNSYVMETSNSSGTPKFYCYNSATGGQVKDVSSATVGC